MDLAVENRRDGDPTDVSAPVVSVLIANFNGAAIIERCIASVLEQQFSCPVEIIVHDDASTDGSAELIRRNFPAVELMVSPENVGFCVANNRMAAAANGRYLLLLNNDAELFPDALATLYEAAAQGDDAVLGLPEYDLGTRALVARGHRLDLFLNPVPNRDATVSEVAMVIGACLWLPRRLWEELGGFPDWFGSIAEDMHLCTCARLRGRPVRVVGRSGFWHLGGASFGGGKVQEGRLVTTIRRRALSERNKTFVMVMSYPTPLLQLVFPVHVLWLIFEGIALGMFTRKRCLFLKIYWPAIMAVWQQRKLLLEQRRAMQDKRRIGVLRFLRPFAAFPQKLRMLVRHGLPEFR